MENKTEEIKKKLEPGEEILWTGKPEEFEFLDVQYKRPFFIKIAICSVLDILLIALYSTMALKSGGKINVLILAVINAIFIAIVLSSLVDAKKIRNSFYCITNKRILQMTDTIKETRYENITDYGIKKDAAGMSSILVGKKALRTPAKLWRSLSVAPVLMELGTTEIRSSIIYGIPEEGKIAEILQKNIKL